MQSKEPIRLLFAKLWAFAENDRRKIIFYSSLFIAANLALLSAPLVFGRIITEIQAGGLHADNIYFILFLLSLLIARDVVFWACHGPARVIERAVAFRCGLRYRHYLLDGVLDLDLAWHHDHDSGDTIDKIRKAVDGLQNFGENVFQIIQLFVRLFGITAVLFLFSPGIALTVFFLVIISLAVLLQFDRKMLGQFIDLNAFANKASASFYDALSNVTSVKILHIEGPVSKGVLARFSTAFGLFLRNAKLNEWKWFSGLMFFQGATLVPLGLYLLYLVKTQQTIDAGTISTLYLYLSELAWVYFGFASFYEMLLSYRNGVINALPLETTIAQNKTVKRTVAPFFQKISFENLSFSYDPAATSQGFKNLSLSISRGERIAVIGESGSGKTTFLKLIHGMYPSACATITFDGTRAVETRLSALDLATMLVPQDPEIFSSSIRDNLTLGIDYHETAVIAAMEVARFNGVLTELPQGLDSVINEKGVNLSGGQRQRLALARAILFSEGKEIILLDESTSSVDSENEIAIYKNIFAKFSGKIIIAAIHKMNLLRFFDRIIIFEKSSLVDEGSFDALLERNRAFKQAWQEFNAQDG